MSRFSRLVTALTSRPPRRRSERSAATGRTVRERVAAALRRIDGLGTRRQRRWAGALGLLYAAAAAALLASNAPAAWGLAGLMVGAGTAALVGAVARRPRAGRDAEPDGRPAGGRDAAWPARLRAVEEALGAVERGEIPAHATWAAEGDADELAVLHAHVVATAQQVALTLEACRETAEALAQGRPSLPLPLDLPHAYGRVVDAAQASAEAMRDILSAIGETMHTLAAGDLTCRVPISATGAWEMLQEDVNRSIANVHVMLKNVREVVGQVTEASEQILSAAGQLSAASEMQFAQSSEIAAAVDQMARAGSGNARQARATAASVQRGREAAQHGRDVVTQVGEKIGRIADVAGNSAHTVERLSASCLQIGEVVDVIGTIADQTNLLALNAAIEAARAGDQGRGFAVVADEVRKLADRTTAATKQIGGMIGAIQTEAHVAVEAVQAGQGEVDEGLRLADQAAAALQAIVADAGQMMRDVDQLATASEQQSATSEQVAQSLQMIAAVSTESAHGIDRIVHAADQLHQTSERLGRLVARFRTEPREAAADPALQAA